MKSVRRNVRLVIVALMDEQIVYRDEDSLYFIQRRNRNQKERRIQGGLNYTHITHAFKHTYITI